MTNNELRLYNAIDEALKHLNFELNMKNYDEEDVSRLNDNSCIAYALLAEAMIDVERGL